MTEWVKGEIFTTSSTSVARKMNHKYEMAKIFVFIEASTSLR